MWSLEGRAAETGLEGVIVPDAHVEFVFHLGTVWRMRRCRNPDWVPQPSAFIYAQQRDGVQLQPLGDSSLVAFRVTPVVAARLLDCSIADLWDAPISLEALIGGDATNLTETLWRARACERFGILERWMARRLRDWGARDWLAHDLFNTVLWRSRTGSMERVARTLGLSARSLRRVFESCAGTSPKDVQLSGRLLAACSLLRDDPALEITEIAASVGFYDHAAFTHAFATRVGLTPSEFRREKQVLFERS